VTQKTIQVGDRIPVPVSSRWLNIISVIGVCSLDSPSFQLKAIAVKSSRQYDLDGITEVYFENMGNTPCVVEYEVAGIVVTSSGGGGVVIENRPIIQRIEEAIQVDAQATVEDGKMRIIRANTLIPINQITIAAGAKKEFVPARESTSRRVTLQVISELETELRVGADSTLTATQGAVIKGSIDAIATAVIENTSAVWLINNGLSEATITGYEEYRP
jgi:hypothetical protein